MKLQTTPSSKTNRTTKTNVHGQGNVQINFEHRKEHPRRSYSASSSNSFLEIRNPYRRSNVHTDLEEVDYSSTMPDLKYSRPEQNL